MNKIIKMAFVVAFIAIAGYGVYANQKTDTMSDLMLANVEALANNSENNGTVDCCNSSDCNGDFVELSILQMVLERDIKCFINNDFRIA